MASFGLPGGAEWAIIALVVVFLFVPGALVFWLGYLTGRGAANRQGAWSGSAARVAAGAPSEQHTPAGAHPTTATGSAAAVNTAGTDGAQQPAHEEDALAEHDADVALTWDSRAGRNDG